MRVLVTGGCGYIGSRLVPYLLHEGHTVTVYDALVFGQPAIPPHSRLRIVVGDIRDASSIRTVMQTQECIIHLAFLSNDPEYQLSPVVAEQVNLGGFAVVLAAALSKRRAGLVLYLAGRVYGTTVSHGTMMRERRT